MTHIPTTPSNPQGSTAKTVSARRVEIYFDTLRSVLKEDPKRFPGVVEYATNPNNFEGVVITIPSEAQSLLKEAIGNVSPGASQAIARAESLTNDELNREGNLFLKSSAPSLKPRA